MSIHRLEILHLSAPLPLSFITMGNYTQAKSIVLLLHGYADQALNILEKFENLFDDSTFVIAPNGPFPLPKKRQSGLLLRYAWYFFDPYTKRYHIDYEFPSQLLFELLKSINTNLLPLTIIGHSQGGYLAPFVAQKIAETIGIVGIACSFKHQLLKDNLDFSLVGIHSKDDHLVDFDSAKEDFNSAEKKSKIGGTFFSLDHQGHDITPEVVAIVRDVVKKMV